MIFTRLKDGDVKLATMLAQLRTLNAALQQVFVYLENEHHSETHCYQFDIDLSDAVRGIGILLRLLEEKSSAVTINERDLLDLESRFRMTMDTKSIDDYLSYLDHQVNALNLLINASSL